MTQDTRGVVKIDELSGVSVSGDVLGNITTGGFVGSEAYSEAKGLESAGGDDLEMVIRAMPRGGVDQKEMLIRYVLYLRDEVARAPEELKPLAGQWQEQFEELIRAAGAESPDWPAVKTQMQALGEQAEDLAAAPTVKHLARRGVDMLAAIISGS